MTDVLVKKIPQIAILLDLLEKIVLVICVLISEILQCLLPVKESYIQQQIELHLSTLNDYVRSEQAGGQET